MENKMGQKILAWALLAALTGGTLFYLFQGAGESAATFGGIRFPGETVIIDAGHGGEDGGAVSLSGVPESNLNLAIALKLDQVLGFYGVNTLLLRTEDVSLHDADADTLREKKVSDLHNRVAMIEAVENATLISIHQNTYAGSSKYHGAQVFYANGELSLPLAKHTQETLRLALDPTNQRVAAEIADSVYLMNHISCRAILVECGFLSNPEEELLLQEPGYQAKIAMALAAAYLGFDG